MWWNHTIHITTCYVLMLWFNNGMADYSRMREDSCYISVKLFTCFMFIEVWESWIDTPLTDIQALSYRLLAIQMLQRGCTPTAVQLPSTSGPQSEKDSVGLIHRISTCPNIKKNTVEHRCPMHCFIHLYFSWGEYNVIRLMVEKGNRGMFLLSLVHWRVFLRNCESLS